MPEFDIGLEFDKVDIVLKVGLPEFDIGLEFDKFDTGLELALNTKLDKPVGLKLALYAKLNKPVGLELALNGKLDKPIFDLRHSLDIFDLVLEFDKFKFDILYVGMCNRRALVCPYI